MFIKIIKKISLLYPEDYKSDLISHTMYALNIERKLLDLIFTEDISLIPNIYQTDNQKDHLFSLLL